jgi:hypothetical protein
VVGGGAPADRFHAAESSLVVEVVEPINLFPPLGRWASDQEVWELLETMIVAQVVDRAYR